MGDQKKIEAAVANIERQHGKNAVMQIGRRNALQVEVIPTGVLSIRCRAGSGRLCAGPGRGSIRAGIQR